MKFERILWNVFQKGKGPKKIHFKEKMLSSFYLRFCITAYFFYQYLFVRLKYFIILLLIFWENIYRFLHNFNVFQIKYTWIDNKRDQLVRNHPVNVTYGTIFINGPWYNTFHIHQTRLHMTFYCFLNWNFISIRHTLNFIKRNLSDYKSKISVLLIKKNNLKDIFLLVISLLFTHTHTHTHTHTYIYIYIYIMFPIRLQFNILGTSFLMFFFLQFNKKL